MKRFLNVLTLVAVAFAAFCGISFAEEAVSATVGAESNFLMVVLKGVWLGVIATLIGWLKNTNPGEFKWRGLIMKVPIGAFIGGLAAWKGMEFTQAAEWASGIGLIAIVEQVIKMVVRRFLPGWGHVEGTSLPPPSSPTEQPPQ